MLWKKSNKSVSGLTEKLIPAELTLPFSKEILQSKFNALQDGMEERGGLPHFVGALQKKQLLFSTLLERDRLETVDMNEIYSLLECMFTARRRVSGLLSTLDEGLLRLRIDNLLYGEGDVGQRISQFVEQMPSDDSKQKRAWSDFAAELLHFREPERYPLMARWVWDENTLSGAFRELIKGTDSLREIPLSNDAGVYQAVCEWASGELTEYGLYRDLHFVVDLVLAKAYSDYSSAVSSHMGMMQAEFGAKKDPLDMVEKLLGIDPVRKNGRSRLNKAVNESTV